MHSAMRQGIGPFECFPDQTLVTGAPMPSRPPRPSTYPPGDTPQAVEYDALELERELHLPIIIQWYVRNQPAPPCDWPNKYASMHGGALLTLGTMFHP